MRILIALLLLVLMNIVQVAIRKEIGFYPDSVTVSVIIGGIMGMFCVFLMRE